MFILVSEQFGLAAITDHDRVDTAALLQRLAAERQFPLLVAVEQIALYLEYAKTHHLLTSSGSDSHGPKKQPIKYRAEQSRALLERLAFRFCNEQAPPGPQGPSYIVGPSLAVGLRAEWRLW